ncbi:hypothetical protein SAMD00019534_036240, partial [Acytostelium subglobosum LB1]|uniref:hypothetical protein n=1 Tax=Acytostelium subglobosum LB1 TaxID=1410327 RepID=UPI0006449055
MPENVTSLTFCREFNQLLKTEYIPSVRSLSVQCPQFSPENISLLGHNCLNELSIVHVATKNNCKSVGTSSLLHQETISHLSKMNTLSHLIIKIKPRKCLKGIDGGMPFSILYSLLKFIPTITLQFCHEYSDAFNFEIIWRLVDDKTALLVPISDADDNGVVLFWKFATHKPGPVTTFKNSTASQAEPNPMRILTVPNYDVAQLREFLKGKTIIQMSRLTKDKLSQYLTIFGIPTTSDTQLTNLKLAKVLSKVLSDHKNQQSRP